MNAETRQALEDSIAHWERMRDNPTRCGERPGPNDCALCRMFILNIPTCNGCPVYSEPERDHCEHTPYTAAHKAWEALCSAIGTPNADYALHRWQEAAQAEIDFLKSLRPPAGQGL